MADGCIVSAQSVSPSLIPVSRWGLWILIISLLSICRGGATNHTTIKTLIYCCPAPGDWAPSLQGRIKPSLLLVPVVSGHRWSPDVRWNCVNSQLYRQLQRLSHPGPPSRVTIGVVDLITRVTNGHCLLSLISHHTWSQHSPREYQTKAIWRRRADIMPIKLK